LLYFSHLLFHAWSHIHSKHITSLFVIDGVKSKHQGVTTLKFGFRCEYVNNIPMLSLWISALVPKQHSVRRGGRDVTTYFAPGSNTAQCPLPLLCHLYRPSGSRSQPGSWRFTAQLKSGITSLFSSVICLKCTRRSGKNKSAYFPYTI
jgi:hypothetical protein